MRLVLDTNVVMSALFWDGAPRRVLDAGDRGDAILITSGRLIAELRTVLSRDKFAGRISEARQTVGNLVESYALRTISVVPVPTPRLAPDPDDDVVIGTAIAAKADLIVTGDKALLSVAQYRGIRIVSVVDALRILTAA